MRQKETKGAIAVQAIAGPCVVLLGLDLAEASSAGALGFAIERINHTKDERYWLKGFWTVSLYPAAKGSQYELRATLYEFRYLDEARSIYLKPDDSWPKGDYDAGSLRQKERLCFAN